MEFREEAESAIATECPTTCRLGDGNEQATLLVVDDEAGIRDLYRDYLEPKQPQTRFRSARLKKNEPQQSKLPQFRLIVAESGEQAVKLVKAELERGGSIQVGFFDMKMPGGIDGLETIRRIRELEPRLLCVIVTAYQDRPLEELAKIFPEGSRDEWDYLSKPFNKLEITQKAHNLCASWRHRRSLEHYTGKLEEAQQALEARVEARTRELVEANERLQRKQGQLTRLLAKVSETNNYLETEKAERERLEAELLLAQKLESIGQLAAGIAHEINTPTQFIGDNVRFLQDSMDELLDPLKRLIQIVDTADAFSDEMKRLEKIKALLSAADLEYFAEEIPQAITQTIEGVERVSKIVRAMKEFSHPGTEEKQAIDLNHALETTITVARNEWKYVAELTTEFDPELHPVACLPAELNQVFLNIIVNAAQAIDDGTGNKGVINISTKARGDWAEIRIKDNGCGIPEQIISKIFDPFFTTKEVGKGTGQGLNIAHNVVTQKHGGTLTVESEEGKGTVFCIRLPMIDTAETEKKEAE